jgi:hypothetical protein
MCVVTPLCIYNSVNQIVTIYNQAIHDRRPISFSMREVF